MFRQGAVVTILIVADDVDNEINYFFIFFCYLFEKRHEILFFIEVEVVIDFLVDLSEALVELLGGVLVFLDVHVSLIQFN